MPQNTQLDGLQFDDLYFPYDRVTAELSQEPRLIRGLNAYITLGGKLAKRPGTLEVTTFGSVNRCDRLFFVDTLENPPKLYVLGSFFVSSTGKWEMFYNRPATGTGWVSLGSTRSLNASTAPHELCVSRGLAYIKSFPDAASSDKYGTSIFDGTGPYIRLWGLPAPQEPVHISGAVNRLNGTITSSATTITLVSIASFPGAYPFTIQIEDETLNVTASPGANQFTVARGYLGTVATTHDDDTIVVYKDWAASTHRVDVLTGWKYVYAWKSVTEHISNRSPLETNMDKLPSITGPFVDLVPKITVQGHADTTNITKIVIYRSTDGGGTFFKLEELTNTGSGNITYFDDSLETGSSGGVFNDPVPDDKLDQQNLAPSLVSNTAPPTVVAPQVIGTDTPAPSTPIAYYAGRLWYLIGNVLFYSGNEEIDEGVPEEAWPAGLNGNFFRLQHKGINVAATNTALYVFTVQAIYKVTGSTKETFSADILYENIGVPYGHPRAITRYGDKVAFLTHDFRLCVINENDELRIVSDPLFTDIIDQLNISSGTEADLKYWGDLDKEWLVLSVHDKVNPDRSKHWILDLKLTEKQKKIFWYVPWTIPSTCTYSGRIAESQSQRRLCFAIYDNSIPYGRLARIDPTARTPVDATVKSVTASGTEGVDFYIDTHLHMVPPGNHANALRVPGMTPVVHAISLERTYIPGDVDPEVYYYKDDFWSDPIHALFVEDPSSRDVSKAYKTLQVHVNEVAHRFAFRLQLARSTTLLEIQNYAIIWNPDAGSTD